MNSRPLFALAMPVVATVAFWLILPASYRVHESSDFESFYRPVAEQLLAGNGFVLPNGAPALRYPPGYPLLVAGALAVGGAAGISEEAALELLVLVSVALSSLFLFLIASDLFTGSLALAPSLLWSSYPLALWLTKQPNSEVPFTIALFGSVLVLWRLLRGDTPNFLLAVASGALAGASMLVRPITLLLPFVFAILVCWLCTAWSRRDRLVVASVIVATSVVAISPWEVHASRIEGHLVLLSTGGVPSMRDGLTFGVNAEKTYRRGMYVPDAVRTVMLDYYAQYNQLDSYRAIASMTARELRTHPLGVAGLAGIKVARAWYGTDSQRFEWYILLVQLFYLTGLVSAVALAWRARGERKTLAIVVVAVVAFFWAMSAVALPLVRYLVPALGLAFVLAPVIVGRTFLRYGRLKTAARAGPRAHPG